MEINIMIRKVIKIDKEKCNGCGLCVKACHEDAIGLIDGKATLLRDDYCDGLGNCLPVCPVDAIALEQRESVEFDEAAVKSAMAEKQEKQENKKLACGCPGSQSKAIKHRPEQVNDRPEAIPSESQLNQWPIQIKLVPINAPYFDNANLLIAADCTAYVYGDFHNRFMKNKITLILILNA